MAQEGAWHRRTQLLMTEAECYKNQEYSCLLDLGYGNCSLRYGWEAFFRVNSEAACLYSLGILLH